MIIPVELTDLYLQDVGQVTFSPYLKLDSPCHQTVTELPVSSLYSDFSPKVTSLEWGGGDVSLWIPGTADIGIKYYTIYW